MKTVQDYLDLGLVFVGDDMINSVTTEPSYGSVSLVDCLFGCGEYPSGIKLVGSMCGMGEWIPSSFAWRNNDGVKPEYKGVVEVELNGGQKRNVFVSELTWLRGFGSSVSKWRPVVLQSDGANKKIQEKFLSALYADSQASKNAWNAIREQFCLPIGIDSPELREAFKSLKDHLERKPKFMIKEEAPSRVRIVNIDGREYLIPSRTPTASPKEDKPMKPVYTAEMHARNELPPIGSMVLVDAEAEYGVKYKDHPTILADVSGELPQLKVMAILTSDVGRRVAVLQNKNNECHCFKLSSVRPIKPIIKTIKVNGFDVPAPMSEAPMFNSVYFTPQTGYEVFYCKNSWRGDKFDSRFLSRGLIHSTESAAIAHAKAMIGIDPNA